MGLVADEAVMESQDVPISDTYEGHEEEMPGRQMPLPFGQEM
jgi:hypothetical protein